MMGSSVLTVLVGAAILCSWACGQTQLSESDEQDLLVAHNHFRGLVDPIATNMERMVWNSELAQVAQTYAEMCVFAHNPQASNQVTSYTFVGENLALTTASPANYTSLVEFWYSEVEDYTYSTHSCTDVCGHYTQVVWATSNNLGCGAFRCAQIQGSSAQNALYLVCNYGPAGNFVGESPYMSGGAVCSACPVEKPACVVNLCSVSATRPKFGAPTKIPPEGFVGPTGTTSTGTPTGTSSAGIPTGTSSTGTPTEPSPSPGVRDEGGRGELLVPLSAGFLAAIALLCHLLQ